MNDVRGYCPMCGGSLVVAYGGHVTCTAIKCPDPSFVADLLQDQERQHIVVLEESTFTVLHPLRERKDHALLRCELHKRIASLTGPPRQPGRYRVWIDEQNGSDWWQWDRLGDVPADGVL